MTKKEIKLSKEFKAQTTKAIVSIGFFVSTYVIILLLAIGLTVLCVYGGIMLVVTYPRFISIALGIGLGSLGILVLIFLVKFVFKSHKVDRSHLYEIKKEDEPELFDLISEIVKEVETSFPKSVYLSSDVNAAVFYDSSFWSMLFPIKKNLQIGLGLVNTVTKEELKAILSHEFGHFSQKTMKVGSYVYNVNQVIFNMIHDNESYDKLIQGWANISGYFSIFVIVAVKIIQGIQWILRMLYGVVNKSYMGLSREMEFHADEIAASVTGYEPLKSSLLRMSLADHSFNSVITYYEGKIAENLKSENIYREQSFILNFLAKQSEVPVVNNLPEVTVEVLNKFNKSKLVIEDQWASHPSTEERIKRLEMTQAASKQIGSAPASELFANIEETQEKLTNDMFKAVKYEETPTPVSFDRFQDEYSKEFLGDAFATMYNGYYDSKNPIAFDIDNEYSSDEKYEVSDLFSDKKVELVYRAIALQNDIEILKQIADKSIPVKTFDYDGKKYKRRESKKLLSDLGLGLEHLNEQIKQNDIGIFSFLYNCDQHFNDAPQLASLYKEFFEFDKLFDSKYEIYTELSNQLQFINYTTPYEQIEANFVKIKRLETRLKSEIKELQADSKYQSELTDEMKENFHNYLSKSLKYFIKENYIDANMEILFTSMNNYAFLLSRGYLLLKKNLLKYQERLIESNMQSSVQ